MRTFTVEEFKKYLMSQDSFGDAVYNCTEEKIIAANEPEKHEYIEEIGENAIVITAKQYYKGDHDFDDGETYWVKNNLHSWDSPEDTEQLDATHVVCFTK